jgi:hypothetical protein
MDLNTLYKRYVLSSASNFWNYSVPRPYTVEQNLLLVCTGNNRFDILMVQEKL